MLFQGAAGNKVVFQVCENKWEVTEQLVHEPLKRLCCICQTEWHKQIFEQAEGGDDGGLLHVLGRHGDLMVPFNKVYA
jgi:hypothetical protein